MTRKEFRELVEKEPLILDGATGTNLQKAGLPLGVCPEQWILEHAEVMQDLQERYVQAGTDILYAPTFRDDGNTVAYDPSLDKVKEAADYVKIHPFSYSVQLLLSMSQ